MERKKIKIPKQEHTAEFKELAVKRVKSGLSVGAAAKELGLVEQTLRNWVKAADAGKLNGAGGKVVTPEQMELSRLRAENTRLKRECKILKKRQARSAVYGATADSVKYAWIDAQRHDFGLDEMCAVLDVSESGYRSWQRGGKLGRKRLTDAQMLALIQSIHAEFRGAYGSPRMVRELRGRSFPASKGRVERLMQENNIRAKHKRRFKVTTDSKHNLPIAPNLLDRKFTSDAPNRVWTSDSTYLWTDEGWLYLAIEIDLFNREVVGWSLKSRMTADIVTDALTMAWFRRKPAAGLIHHSDRGSQYASHAFRAKLKEYGMACSMSRKGNCWDNAPTESWFGSFKNERVYGERFETRDEVIAMTFEYIEVFYNRKRRHSTLGYKSPAQFMSDWFNAPSPGKLVA